MRGLALVVVAVLVVGLLFTRAEPLGPHATLVDPPSVVGAGTPVHVVATDRGSGVALIRVQIVPGDGSAPVVLVEEGFPRVSWLGSGVHQTELTTTLGERPLAEGPATLEVWVSDHSWLDVLRRGPRLAVPVTVDRTPPTAQVLTTQHVVRVGGSESVVLRVSPDTDAAGVQVGPYWFPATKGFFADPALLVALFAVPWDAPQAVPQVVVADAAGNRRTLNFDVSVRPRRFAEKTLPITEDFLQRKVPELLAANGMDTSGTLIDGFLRINRDLRHRTEERMREICRDSASTILWEGAFSRLPDSAPLSSFADARTYMHDGQMIDRQTHLGFDLASLKRAVVPAANIGRVTFTGPLGIYGNTVILDHGLGLFSLYGHLNDIGVQPGQEVKKGDPLGHTGDTGLAGGDHLHFSTMLHGIHVDPVEWWDAHWIHDHVLARLAPYPRAGTAPAAPAPAGQAPASGGQASAPATSTTVAPAPAPPPPAPAP